ncbi:MAG TPA: hypothetical protein VEA63_06995 [Opitutus sp.]|nr:hypothetical protein [Opitutus sp.]
MNTADGKTTINVRNEELEKYLAANPGAEVVQPERTATRSRTRAQAEDASTEDADGDQDEQETDGDDGPRRSPRARTTRRS